MCVETVTTRGGYYHPFAKYLLFAPSLLVFSVRLPLNIPAPREYSFPQGLCPPSPPSCGGSGWASPPEKALSSWDGLEACTSCYSSCLGK